jgi:hypothetical protein
MARYNSSRSIPVALVLIIVAVAIAALVSLTRAVFFSGQSSPNSNIDSSQTALLNTTVTHSVRMTVRGNIVANENFNSYQITVTPSSRNLTTYTGYLGTQSGQVALDNNIPAYDQFVNALNRANMVKGTELTGDKNDTRGVCATGLLYQYEVLNSNNAVKTLWTSTCKGSPGSLDASVTQLTNLFTTQIPNAKTITGKLNL